MPYKDKEDKKKWDKQHYKDNREECIKYAKEYRENHPKKVKKVKEQYRKTEKGKEIRRKARVEYKYGLSHKDWEGLWYAQDGRCAICDKFFTKMRDICVDHNHETGKVRGLLCSQCNIGLGYVEDSEFRAEAIEYLNIN